MHDPLRLLLFALALLAPAAAFAQDAASADNAQIVVTGRRPSPEAIATFVDAALPRIPGRIQTPRFHWEVCPRAAGVLAQQAAAVEKRIRAVARAAKIDVAGSRCAPNLLVVVTPDKAGFLAALSERRPEYFEGLTRAQRCAFSDPANPVAAWHVPGLPITADGHYIDQDKQFPTLGNRTTRVPSRIVFPTRPQFAAAIVVIDAAALDGLTTIQLADYASMRALMSSQPALLGDVPAPTILRIIDAPMGSEVPLTLTSWDLGALTAFYASDPKISAASQRSAVRRDLGRRLEGEDGGRN